MGREALTVHVAGCHWKEMRKKSPRSITLTTQLIQDLQMSEITVTVEGKHKMEPSPAWVDQ